MTVEFSVEFDFKFVFLKIEGLPGNHGAYIGYALSEKVINNKRVLNIFSVLISLIFHSFPINPPIQPTNQNE